MNAADRGDGLHPLHLGWLEARTGDARAMAARMDGALAAGRGLTVGFVNPHVYVTARDAPAVREHLDACDLVCVDGVGVALAHRLVGHRLVGHRPFGRRDAEGGRVPRTVAEHLFRAFWTRCPHAVPAVLIGIEADALTRAAAALDAASTGPRVAGTLHGWADDATVRRFLGAHPDARLVLIGAGSPRSEAIANLARRALPGAVVFHCGAGTLKTWAGTKRRAPAWVSRAGLEWLHRIAFEPHARARYLVGGPRFARALLRPNDPTHEHRKAAR